jgi:hypothetical protein
MVFHVTASEPYRDSFISPANADDRTIECANLAERSIAHWFGACAPRKFDDIRLARRNQNRDGLSLANRSFKPQCDMRMPSKESW